MDNDNLALSRVLIPICAKVIRSMSPTDKWHSLSVYINRIWLILVAFQHREEKLLPSEIKFKKTNLLWQNYYLGSIVSLN